MEDTMQATGQVAHVDKTLIAKIIAGIGTVWVQFPPALITLVSMMALDYITGLAAAGYKGEMDSTKAKRGIWGKIAKLSAAIAGYVVSASIPPITVDGVQFGVNIGSAICGAFIIAEFISNLENVGRIGLLPGRVQKILTKFKNDETKQS